MKWHKKVNNKKTVEEILTEECQQTLFFQKLGLIIPGLPGYTILRKERSLADFTKQLLLAAQFLQKRHGLQKGCLKASDAGDGVRITPNINLMTKLVWKLWQKRHTPMGMPTFWKAMLNIWR